MCDSRIKSELYDKFVSNTDNIIQKQLNFRVRLEPRIARGAMQHVGGLCVTSRYLQRS